MRSRHKLFFAFSTVALFVLILYFRAGLNVQESGAQDNSKNFSAYTIRGTSMEPTLKDGDQVYINQDYYKTRNLAAGDIIVFKLKTQEKPFVKRIIALPGDKLELGEDGKIYINGETLEEPYPPEDYHFDPSKIRVLLIPLSQTNSTVPEGTVLVLGDNRRNSFDSEDYGFVPVEYILGKVIGR